MPRGGAQFSSKELDRVLSHYDIGVILQVQVITGGSRRSPKVVLISEQGKFLLKRRPKGKDDLAMVTYAHAVQKHLREKAFPVTSLLTCRNNNDTFLQLNNHVYELFEFVTGIRYDGSPQATAEAGRQLAHFHLLLADFAQTHPNVNHCFHNASIVRRHLRMLGSEYSAGANATIRFTAEKLNILYNESSAGVERLDFETWPQQVIHGDWHPGNMLFRGYKLAAILDFDSVRIASPVTDLANALLQFSIVGGKPNPADWPDYFDENKLAWFLEGYNSVIKPDKNRLSSLVDLMIETMIAESVLPIAATGFFGHLSGTDFLEMILRKANWLNVNRNSLTQLICK